jgi:hypothetical protein
MRRFIDSPLSRSLLLLAVALPAAAGCGLRPPIQNSGPAVSREGVQVAVTRQGCSQSVEPEQPGNDLVEEILEVQVRNATPAPLTVHRDAFRLVTPEGYSLETVTFRAIDPLTIAGGETRTFELRYMTRGSLQCAREMRLEAGRSMTLGNNPVDVGVVRFIPSRAI